MKICLISKYPPIEGGVSSSTYWDARALGEAGHEVFVVSNNWEVEERFREEIRDDELDKFEPKNVKVFSTQHLPGFYPPIPYFNPYVEKIASLAIEVIRKYGADIIFSNYLLPYGVAAYLSKIATGTPLVTKHAGSDITTLYTSPFLKPIFMEVFKMSDRILTGGYHFLSRFGGIERSKLITDLHPPTDLKFFNPNVEPFDFSKYTDKDLKVPIFTYFGKILRMKRTHELILAASKIKEDFLIFFVTENRGEALNEIKKLAEAQGLKEKIIFLPFQPPWKIPSILKASTCVVCPESNKTYPTLENPLSIHTPGMAREAMACGKCVILGEEIKKRYIYQNLEDGANVITVDTEVVSDFSEKLKFVINNQQEVNKIGVEARKFSEKSENYGEYIKRLVNLFEDVIK